MNNIAQTVQEQLFALQDLKYRDFHCKLMPTVDPETVIGIRIPALRKFTKAFAKTPEAVEFMQILPHKYYEENNLHGFLIECIKDYNNTISALDAFLPYIDNWATCDLISPKLFRKHLPQLLPQIQLWITSSHTYTVRFAIRMLMSFYLDEQFQPEYLELVANVRSEEYYINMMIAWYFATALAKQYQATLPYLQQHRLSPWTHNKTIQKAIESYRISDGQKACLRSLKLKIAKGNH